MDRKDSIILATYAALTALIVLVIALNGMTSEVTTRLLVIAFFGLQLLVFPTIKKLVQRITPKWRFIMLATLFAMVVEGLHMISKPLDQSLLITAGMPVSQMIRNYAIDLVFTTPAYVIIFLVMWYFINKYEYAVWEFVIIMGIGQALGDGSFFFLANPLLVVFIAYVAVNYHAMNIIPYMLIEKELGAREKSWKRYVALVVLPVTYVVCGGAIKLVARVLGAF